MFIELPGTCLHEAANCREHTAAPGKKAASPRRGSGRTLLQVRTLWYIVCPRSLVWAGLCFRFKIITVNYPVLRTAVPRKISFAVGVGQLFKRLLCVCPAQRLRKADLPWHCCCQHREIHGCCRDLKAGRAYTSQNPEHSMHTRLPRSVPCEARVYWPTCCVCSLQLYDFIIHTRFWQF